MSGYKSFSFGSARDLAYTAPIRDLSKPVLSSKSGENGESSKSERENTSDDESEKTSERTSETDNTYRVSYSV